MNAPQTVSQAGDTETRMQETLDAQREEFLREGAVSAETRIDRIDRAMDALLKYQDRLCEALDSDMRSLVDMLQHEFSDLNERYHALINTAAQGAGEGGSGSEGAAEAGWRASGTRGA